MSINKLSKYGIVLVAAVTVATVAQSQFGQSSSKVYADEIASTVPKTSEAPSTTPATSEAPAISTTPAVSTSPETSEAPVVSTTPAMSEAPAVVSTSENSEAPATSASYSEHEGLGVTPTGIVSPTSTTSSENSRDKDETEEFKSFYFRYVEHTDSGDIERGNGAFGPNEDGRFVLPERDDYRYSYYTITSDDGKSFKAGEVIPYDSPLLNHPNFDDNPITYTYYKNKPSVEGNIVVNSINRPSWHHGDSISYHVRYGVFERNSKYGVPAVIDIAPYDTVVVPLDKEVTVSAKTIPGYTLDSANKYETGSDIPDNTLKLSSSYFVTDNTGTPMAMFLYKKNNSETPFKDSLTPSAKPSSQSEGPLTYTVIYHFTGEDPRSVEYTIEPGETEHLGFGGKGAASFPVIIGTPSFYEVTYDRVKAGKTLYEFWQYDDQTHNGDGTPKVTDTTSTPETSTTPATSEAPAASTTPATSEAPAVSTTPATSEAPAASTTPATSEAPAASTTPATSEAPAVSTTPATSEAPAASTTPATSEAPAVSTTPATSEAPAVSTAPATSEAPAVSTTPAVTPSTSVNPASSVTLDKLSQKAYKKMSSAQKGALVSSPLASKADHSMDSAMISSTQSHDEGMTPATDGKLAGHNLPDTGDTNAKVGILGMIFVGLGLTSLVYKGRHRRSK